jgi:hypothetical protein
MTIILDLCGGTGSWSRPYAEARYDVRVKTLPQDVRDLPWIDEPIHGILCAPPCTMFAASGNRWVRTEAQMRDALSIVDACLRAVVIYKPKWWALENPVGKIRRWLGPPAYVFDPCNFGEPYTKRTLLWGRFTPPMKLAAVTPEFVVCNGNGKRMSKIHHDSFNLPPEERSRVRSITPPGFARAFFEANP